MTDDDVRAQWKVGQGTTPSLDDVIHWLIDDTWLDHRPATATDPRADLFSSAAEAETVQATVDTLDELIAELGDVPSSEYVCHATWPLVVHRCHLALDALLQHG